MMAYSLTDEVPNVPRASRPVFWDTTKEVRVNLLRIQTWIAHYNYALPGGAVIDEAAVLVPSPYLVRKLAGTLAEEGWEMFNTAEDIVYTNPFGTRYFVEYSFMRHPDQPYRLELMTRSTGYDEEPGFSPLHAALVNAALPDLYPMPHLSFKPGRAVLRYPSFVSEEAGKNLDRLQTWGQAYSSAVQFLKDKACIHAMTCQSTYGTFGYFIGNETARQIYLKPRVNLRDK
jgi:hypothetical protein